ncbi:MAG: LssY C-terminal domain-containing protein [Opitutaceae bacterium]
MMTPITPPTGPAFSRAGTTCREAPWVRSDGLNPSRQLIITAVLAILATFIAGCTTIPFETPAPFDSTVLKNRARSTEDEGIRVSAALIDSADSRAIFGVDVLASGIQPIWFEIENRTDRRVVFLPTGVDPEYFSPLEVSFRFYSEFNRESKTRIDEAIERSGLEYTIMPHSSESGFVFTNLQSGARFVTVDLLSDNWAGSYFLVLPPIVSIPADRSIEELIQQSEAAGTVDAGNDADLRELLEQLPTHATDKDGNPGEPLNLILVGDLEPAVSGLIRRRYQRSDLAPLYALGRVQDSAVTKQERWNPSQPHQIRLWLTEIRYRGIPVWIAQASMPLGGRFRKNRDGGVQAPIDPNVDAVRNDIVQDTIYSQFASRIGFIKGVDAATMENPRPTPSGGVYHTDGLRAVIFFDDGPSTLDQVQFLDWERLAPQPGSPSSP